MVCSQKKDKKILIYNPLILNELFGCVPVVYDFF